MCVEYLCESKIDIPPIFHWMVNFWFVYFMVCKAIPRKKSTYSYWTLVNVMHAKACRSKVYVCTTWFLQVILKCIKIKIDVGFPGGSVVKNPPSNAVDCGSIPGSGRSPGEGNDNPLQYSCLEIPLDRGVWWARVQRVSRDLDMTHWLNTHKDRYKYR